MLRLSSYSILSEALPGGGYALMNSCTGAVDLLSDELAKIIKQSLLNNDCDPYPDHASKVRYKHNVPVPTNLIPAHIIEEFLGRGHFTRLNHEEERTYVAKVATLLHELAAASPHFLIVPNLDCNYRCTYCFERPLQIGLNSKTSEINYQKRNVVMRRDHVDAIYDSIDKIRDEARSRIIWSELKAAGRVTDEENGRGLITLYGGEPLDVANKDIVFEIVNRGAMRGHEFAAITNGHDLSHFLPILGTGKISQVQISIDGPKKIHDKSRLARNRESSFDNIIANIRTVLASGGVEVQLRCHVDPKNIELFDELLKVFQDEGWLNHEKVVVYASNYHVKDKEGHVTQGISYADVLEHWHAMASSYTNVFLSGIGIHAERLLLPALKMGQPARLKGTYCGANSGTYIFAPDGFIYSCWESVGKECSKIGNYMTASGLVLDKQATDRWFKRSVATIPECLDCCYALVCGGGCAQYAEYNNGTLYKPYCDEFDVVYPTALAKTVEDFLVGTRAAVRTGNSTAAVTLATE
jgi:uncharacterized protein